MIIGFIICAQHPPSMLRSFLHGLHVGITITALTISKGPAPQMQQSSTSRFRVWGLNVMVTIITPPPRTCFAIWAYGRGVVITNDLDMGRTR